MSDERRTRERSAEGAQARRDVHEQRQITASTREAEVVENVIQGLAENLAMHGRMYCPCADVEDSKTKGNDMVCPCKPHHADIARQGYCDCALYASAELVERESPK